MSSTTCGSRRSAALYAAHFLAQPLVDLLGVGRVERNQEREHPGALDVLQEPEAEALAGVRPFDDAGDVGHDEACGGRRARRRRGWARAW